VFGRLWLEVEIPSFIEINSARKLLPLFVLDCNVYCLDEQKGGDLVYKKKGDKCITALIKVGTLYLLHNQQANIMAALRP